MSGPLHKALPPTLKELRILCCQQSQPSAGARAFIEKSYLGVKAKNPNLPILIREALGTPPRAFARFEKGQEKQVSLEGASDATEVEKRIAGML
ncbi:NADH dehydrogenase, alpha subcomplex, subunit 2 [Cystobasidium minutum MCA 4210]|uniref:NADH dehydrogenase, alpha subcomplex, subunit 2 n=1 Tax=Cystobasidium minutum MCA 4210 TaxID=1397322 RepID=UPI0034CD529E|eukprot:jgi/Rhomi1/172943/fgenesh1_kg.5_\